MKLSNDKFNLVWVEFDNKTSKSISEFHTFDYIHSIEKIFEKVEEIKIDFTQCEKRSGKK